jgi:hypothetical protein
MSHEEFDAGRGQEPVTSSPASSLVFTLGLGDMKASFEGLTHGFTVVWVPNK